MTSSDPLLPVPEDDALDAAASAVVDGVASPEEAAAVAAAPDGAARVAALRAVAEAVGSDVGAQRPGAAERGRAAALAAFDTRGGAEAGAEAGVEAPVTRLAPRAADRSRRLARIGTVAAALLLLVGIGAFSTAVLSSDDDSGETSTAAAPARDSQAEGAGTGVLNAQDRSFASPASSLPPSAKGNEVPAPAAASAPAAPGQPQPPVVNGGDIGRQDEIEMLAQRAAAALDGVPDATVAAADAALPREIQACSASRGAVANEPVTALRYRAVGTFQGTPAIFLAYDRTATPPRVLLVLARADCSVLASTHF